MAKIANVDSCQNNRWRWVQIISVVRFSFSFQLFRFLMSLEAGVMHTSQRLLNCPQKTMLNVTNIFTEFIAVKKVLANPLYFQRKESNVLQ